MKEETLFRSFVDGTSDLVQSIKPDGTIEYVNSTWLRTLQYSQGEVNSIKLKDIVFPGYLKHTEDEFSKIFEGKTIDSFVVTLVSKYGTPIQVEGKLFPLFHDDLVIAAAGILTNINDRNRVLEELRHEQSRVEFLLDLMTHDLTNINQEIVSVLEVAILSSKLPEELVGLLNECLFEVDRGSNLISNVKTLWKIARKPPRMYCYDLVESLFAAKEFVEQSFPHKEMDFRTELKLGTLFVTADEFLIEVFKNLLHNAMKYDTRDRVRIEVESEVIPHTPFLKLQVKDYGPGITDSDKSIIFEQLSHRRDSLRGLGLGLTLTKHVIENYGGYIRVEDRVEGTPESGANFILLLRLSDAEIRQTSEKGDAK